MDPQQRILIETTYEAIENSGLSPESLAAQRTGVFIGLTSDEYSQLSHKSRDLTRFDAYFASGVARSVACGRLSYFLGTQGPNMSIDTACSSSLVAVHTACLNLRADECRIAIAGGVNVVLLPEITISFSQSRMLASDGRCKTFDSAADGFVRGEGCGVVILKRLSDAIIDGDNVLAVIRGTAINQDGRSGGLTVPSGPAQEAVVKLALENAKLRPHDVDYVESHGTGTSLGDPIEAHALVRALAHGRPSDFPLTLGAVKTNIGHLEAAAGIAGLIEVVLSMQNECIPANLHFKSWNSHINLQGTPVVIPTTATPWRRGQRPRIAGVSSFGFSGTNAHVILEEAPEQAGRGNDLERPAHLLTLSARSEASLNEVVSRYQHHLSNCTDPIGDVCFTANAGRTISPIVSA